MPSDRRPANSDASGPFGFVRAAITNECASLNALAIITALPRCVGYAWITAFGCYDSVLPSLIVIE